MLELGNSQASCTARRLVGQTIQAMEKKRTGAASGDKRRTMNPTATATTTREQRRQFRYTFAPSNHNGSAAAVAQSSSGGIEFLQSAAKQQSAGPLTGFKIQPQRRRNFTTEESKRQQQQDHGRRRNDYDFECADNDDEPKAGEWKIGFSLSLSFEKPQFQWSNGDEKIGPL